MLLSKEEKKEIIKNNSNKEGDTGSTKVQIALLNREIEELNKHFKQHPGDFHSKRGLLTKNKKRNTLIRYSQKKQN
ncbi:MAG: 30S ribosomal protein S15 ['Conium maculatum' witches'-broom phytoplasma]|uniref:30S ribosomal protein S15 n=1 Tax=Candidatus Phytoplasma pruni TaxID=479893 RepID=A0A851HGW4_9MOLU|nr:30S ribosomal protein S15 [Candidatus Phytoplasma pruni]MEC4558579.1 30S ribosomal protein S15 ['Conium maculatum' witches'-broom phytoplasma]NWN45514.1 30S ribosomal protein S15 [Candidatus Phytoplasma pruni]